MANSSNGTRILFFDEFEFDLHRLDLRRNQRRVYLREQPLRVLAALVESPDALVTRNELHGKLWSAGTFVDFDHSLNNAINRLRDALDDSAANPKFIETVPRRGYRFIATVHRDRAAVPKSARGKRTQRRFD
jgi:DNA-binding winged helix-turn-helix (wHTH) protein